MSATEGSTPSEERTPTFWERCGLCLLYGGGIIGALVVYGLLQEKIMQIPYGDDLFSYATFLVFCNRISNATFGLVMIFVKGETLWYQCPPWKYMIVSFSNVAATSCQYEALKYVSFPVQMLGKSFKMLPVMIWGVIISSKKYKIVDWLIAAGVTAGVTEFLLTGNISSPSTNSSSVWGLLLLVAFLACDGLTSTFQEKLFKEHKTSKYNQMLYVNLCSAIVSLVALLVGTNLVKSIQFCIAHPAFVRDVVILSASATTSQFFIYSQVKEFGALVFAATMNVRQVVSIIVSYIRYGHIITVLQVLGLVIVFGALFYKSYLGFTSTSEEKKPLVPKYDSEAPPYTSEEKKPLGPTFGNEAPSKKL